MSDLSAIGPDTWVQLLSLIVYVGAIVWGGLAFLDIRRSHHARAVKYLASGLVTLSLTTAGVFITAQIPWIVDQQWRVMSLTETLTWLLYDWLNGLAHLAIVLAVRAFMRWELPTPCQAGGVCPSSLLVRRAREQDQELTGMRASIQTLQQRIEHLAEDMTRDD